MSHSSAVVFLAAMTLRMNAEVFPSSDKERVAYFFKTFFIKSGVLPDVTYVMGKRLHFFYKCTLQNYRA
jgi:hypothetical protein